MNTPLDMVSEDELHGFVDGQLDADRLPAVVAWLQANPDDALRVAQWQTQNVQLRQHARRLELGDTPNALTQGVLRAAAGARRSAPWRQAVAAALLLGVGLGAGYWSAPRGALPAPPVLAQAPAFVREAALAHAVFVPEKRHPVEVAAADEAHLVQWLSRRLGAPLKVPSLAAQGFHLLGGRLLPGETAPRAQFMFENEQGLRVTLFVAVFGAGQAPAATVFRSVHDSAGESFYWVEDQFGYALSGNLAASELQALAREVYAQLAH